MGSVAEGSSAVELFRQLLGLECLCSIHSRLCFPESSEVVLQTVLSRHGVDSHEWVNHAFSLIELQEHLNSSHFLGSFGTIESPTLVSAILIDGVVGCGSGNGDAEHVPQQFHCKKGFLDRCGECEQIFMLARVMCSLLGNAGIGLVDLDVNEAGMRLSLRIPSWSEAGERLRSRVASWSGKTCTAGTDSAHRRVCPGGSLWWYGCFCTAPSAAQDQTNGTLVVISVKPISPRPRLLLSGNS